MLKVGINEGGTVMLWYSDFLRTEDITSSRDTETLPELQVLTEMVNAKNIYIEWIALHLSPKQRSDVLSYLLKNYNYKLISTYSTGLSTTYFLIQPQATVLGESL